MCLNSPYVIQDTSGQPSQTAGESSNKGWKDHGTSAAKNYRKLFTPRRAMHGTECTKVRYRTWEAGVLACMVL
jgi:hypothetical protein